MTGSARTPWFSRVNPRPKSLPQELCATLFRQSRHHKVLLSAFLHSLARTLSPRPHTAIFSATPNGRHVRYGEASRPACSAYQVGAKRWRRYITRSSSWDAFVESVSAVRGSSSPSQLGKLYDTCDSVVVLPFAHLGGPHGSD